MIANNIYQWDAVYPDTQTLLQDITRRQMYAAFMGTEIASIFVLNREYPEQWLKEEKTLIKKAVDAGKTVVGFCLGGQLITCALGGKVTKNEQMELGWQNVRFNAAARKHRILSVLSQDMTVFQWHEDTFSILPEDALCIASNEACAHQGFVYRDRVFAFQFHFEINAPMFTILTKELAKLRYSGTYIQTIEQIERRPELIEENNGLLCQFLDALEE
jgi:GMP synthase-like glutamine amidotransferase